jgi:hypothetical protein
MKEAKWHFSFSDFCIMPSSKIAVITTGHLQGQKLYSSLIMDFARISGWKITR